MKAFNGIMPAQEAFESRRDRYGPRRCWGFWPVPCPVRGAEFEGRDAVGLIGEVEVDALMKFGKARGFDLEPEMQRIYKKDEEALGRLFALSLKFKNIRPEGADLGSNHV